MAGYFKSFLGRENMITDIECRSEIGPDLDSTKLNPYWQQYFDFLRDAAELHALSEAALTSALNGVRAQSRPFLDAQRAIFIDSSTSDLTPSPLKCWVCTYTRLWPGIRTGGCTSRRNMRATHSLTRRISCRAAMPNTFAYCSAMLAARPFAR
jgi:hypothetical protein